MRTPSIVASILAVGIGLWTGPTFAQNSPDPHQHGQADVGNSASGTQDPMMQMMSGMMGMMQMMHGQGGMAGPSGMGMPGMGMLGMGANDRIEGRIAFLHAELKITAAQEVAWKKFADVLRENSKKTREMGAGSMQMQESDLAALAANQAKQLQARADELMSMSKALKPLLESLSPEQKKTASELLPQQVSGMMSGMMPGMMGGQMMGSGMPGMPGGSQQDGGTTP